MKRQGLLKCMSQITKFALPISTGNIVRFISGFVGMLFLARLGKVELAAGALVSSTFMRIVTILTSFMYAVGILISHNIGQGNPDAEVGRIARAGLCLGALMSLPMSFLIWQADMLLLMFHESHQFMQIITPYFHFSAMIIPLFAIGTVLAQCYVGIGKPRFCM